MLFHETPKEKIYTSKEQEQSWRFLNNAFHLCLHTEVEHYNTDPREGLSSLCAMLYVA